MITAEVAVDSAVICDDVRREINNKAILIGVWPLELAVPSYPYEVSFVLHVEGKVIKSGHIAPRLRVEDESGGVLYDTDSKEKLEEGQFLKGRFSIDFNVELHLYRSSRLTFWMSMGAHQQDIAERRVDLVEIFKAERDEERRLLNPTKDSAG